MGWSGDEFYIPRHIPDSHMFIRYPTHIQRGLKIEPYPLPRRVWISLSHPRLRIELFFLIKNRSFFATPREML